MIATFHNHTTFCDGKNTPREMVEYAYEKGIRAIGLSGHGYAPYDLGGCMKDTEDYILEVNQLKKEFDGKIEVYLGVEEDVYAPVERKKFDYIIGSMHYIRKGEEYYSIDGSVSQCKTMRAAFQYDVVKIATEYFTTFCQYIKSRNPDIIGHFDLLTKYDRVIEPLFLNDKNYHALAEKYLDAILPTDCIFEVNVGAILRGYRTTPYPYENLLYKINEADGKIILSLDAHDNKFLTYDFSEIVYFLKNVGFSSTYTIKDGIFIKESL